jgi:hypothetical protein
MSNQMTQIQMGSDSKVQWQTFRLDAPSGVDRKPEIDAILLRESDFGWYLVGLIHSSQSQSFYLILERVNPLSDIPELT